MKTLARVRLSACLPIVAGAFLSVFFLFLLADTAHASQPLFAGMGEYFSGLARRDRVIQVSVVVMCLALFILMKKFGPTDR